MKNDNFRDDPILTTPEEYQRAKDALYKLMYGHPKPEEGSPDWHKMQRLEFEISEYKQEEDDD